MLSGNKTVPESLKVKVMSSVRPGNNCGKIYVLKILYYKLICYS
jgi:hypothetical protein